MHSASSTATFLKLFAIVLMVLPVVLSELTPCDDGSDCQNSICYTDTNIVDGTYCLCDPGHGGIDCLGDPDPACTLLDYDGPSFSSVVHAEWVAGDKVVIQVVVPYQSNVAATRIQYDRPIFFLHLTTSFNYDAGETLCDYPAGEANAGVTWSVSPAQDTGGAECTQIYTVELTFAQVTGVDGSLTASPNTECFSIPAVPSDGDTQVWTARLTVVREYSTTFNGSPVSPLGSNEHTVQVTFPATADFTQDASITFANIEDAVLIRQSFASGKWQFLVDAYVPHPLQIVLPFSFDPATINGVAFSSTAVSACAGNPFCVQRVSFELVTTDPAVQTVTITLPLECKAGFTCGSVPDGEITLNLRLPDMAPIIDDVAPVTATPSMHRNTYGGPLETFYIATESIYFVLALTHPQNTLVSSATLASVRVGGSEIDLEDTDIVTIPGLQGDQTYRFALVVGTKAPWPVDSSNGNPSSVTIAGDLDYVLGDFTTKRVAFSIEKVNDSAPFTTHATIVSSKSSASTAICTLAILIVALFTMF